MYSLNNQGYYLPEAFTWEGKQIRGYWISKYQFKEVNSVKAQISGADGVIRVKNILSQYGSGYTYEMYLIKNGKRIVWNSAEKKYIEGTEGIPLTTNSYTFKNLEPRRIWSKYNCQKF